MIDSRNTPPAPPGANVDILFRQPVPAPGGTQLAAMVFRPRGQTVPLPVIVFERIVVVKVEASR